MRNLLATAFSVGLLAIGATQAHAQTGYFEVVPNVWRLQDYNDGKVNIFYTGSPCSNGRLELSASAPDGSKDRLWATILTAKISQQTVGVYFHVDAGQCLIDTFYVKETN